MDGMIFVGVLVACIGVGSYYGGVKLMRELSEALSKRSKSADAKLLSTQLHVEDQVDGRRWLHTHEYGFTLPDGAYIKATDHTKREWKMGTVGHTYKIWYNPDNPYSVLPEKAVSRTHARVVRLFVTGTFWLILGIGTVIAYL